MFTVIELATERLTQEEYDMELAYAICHEAEGNKPKNELTDLEGIDLSNLF